MTEGDPVSGQPGESLLGDQSRRWRDGQPLAVEEYLRRLPSLRSDPELLLDLIYHEVALRERSGESPHPEEYLARFPELREPLQALFDVHRLAGPATPPSPSVETVDEAQRTGSYHAPDEADPEVWYYASGRQKLGPFSSRRLRQLAAEGVLQPDTMLWRQGTPRWLPAGSVPELFDTAGHPGPPPAGKKEPTLPAVPGYEVLGVLGKGGMGVVYKARQKGLNRTVALKMILVGDHAQPDALARFKTEAEAVARLQHPHIVAVHEVGEHEGLPFFSLEFVAGGSLAQKLAGTPLSPGEAARLVETLARALHAAHQRGVIHRDLKPANVLLAEDGTPKVTDFGLAKQLDDDSGRTREGDVMGTPSYMAPEQAAGDLRLIGPHTDVYALGAILYECLTGRPPFKGATMLETLEQVRQRDPVPPRHLQPKVPRDLEIICLKCLQKEPPRRYVSSEALAGDLHRYLDGEPILAKAVGPWERAVKWARRRPAVAALAALVVVVAVAGLAGILWKWQEAVTARGQEAVQKAAALEAWGKEKEAREAAQEAKTRAETAEQATKRKNEQLERRAYVTNIGAAARALAANDVALARDYLGTCKPALRHWEWYHLRRQCQAERFSVWNAESFAFSPGGDSPRAIGKRLATLDSLSVRFRDADAGHEVEVVKVALEADRYPVFSPDCKRLALVSRLEKRLTLRDLASGKDLWSVTDFQTPLQTAAFSPDGSRLAVAGGHLAGGPGELKVLDAGTGKLLLDVKETGAEVQDVCFSPDGTRLAAAGGDHAVRLWELPGGKEPRVLRGHESAVLGVAFGPDGSRLVTGGADGTVRIWDLSGTQPVVCRGHAGRVNAVAFRPDGRQVASGGADRAVRVWDLAGQEVAVYRGHGDPIERLAFSPDGARLASADLLHQVKVWDATAPPASLRPGNLALASAVAFSPDGGRLAAGTVVGAVSIWDRGTGALLRLAAAEQGGRGRRIVIGLAFRPGGKELASGHNGGALRVWDAVTGRQVRELSFAAGVMGLAYSPDGARLAVRTGDAVRLLDAGTGHELAGGVFPLPPSPPAATSPPGPAFSPDGRRLAIAGEGGHNEVVQIVDLGTRRRLFVLRGHPMPILDVAWQGEQLATLSNDGTVKVWDVAADHPPTTRLTRRIPVLGAGHLTFSPDGRRLVALTDQELKLWELVEGEEMLSLAARPRGLAAVAFSPDGRFLAATGLQRSGALDGGPLPEVFSVRVTHATSLPAVAYSPDARLLGFGGAGQVLLWDAATGESRAALSLAQPNISGLAFGPDGKLLAAAAGDYQHPGQPGEVKVWDVAALRDAVRDGPPTVKEAHTLRGHAALVMSVAFSADGRRLASGSVDRTVKLWDAATGKEERTLPGHRFGVRVVRFSPDGARVASCDFATVSVWDADTGRRLYVCEGGLDVGFRDVFFSPDGKELVTADSTGVRVWDAATGREAPRGRRTLADWDRAVSSLVFSPDGKYLAGAAAFKGEVAVWEVASGQKVLTYPVEVNQGDGLAFSPPGKPGRHLAVAGKEALTVWEVSEKWQAAEAERRRQEQPRLLAWHLGEALPLDWFAVRFHRSCLIALEPDNGGHHAARADADAELGRWDEADADAAGAVELSPDDLAAWRRRVLLDLHAGDAARYRKTCARLLGRHGETKDAEVAGSVAWDCGLAPEATAEPERVVRLAEQAVAGEARGDRLGTLGAALYRAGRHEQAAARLHEAIKAHGGEGTFREWFFLAMASHHLGQADEARRCLDRAVQKGEKEADGWQQRQERDLLRAEAEGLLKERK
jgi:WD40 repeat protein/tRNA A-37 threonylcarbamoyl transferase component Bud32